jgi:hypothetical protein
MKAEYQKLKFSRSRITSRSRLYEMVFNFQEVCQLAEDKETELSDAGLVVLMSAIQHRVQLEGWTSNRVTSLLTWAQQVSSMTSHDYTNRQKMK